MRYTEASSLARMFCFHKQANVRLGRCSIPEHLAEMPLVRQAQAVALLGASGPFQRSAATAQAPGKPDLVRAVEQAALPVLLAATMAREEQAALPSSDAAKLAGSAVVCNAIPCDRAWLFPTARAAGISRNSMLTDPCHALVST